MELSLALVPVEGMRKKKKERGRKGKRGGKRRRERERGGKKEGGKGRRKKGKEVKKTSVLSPCVSISSEREGGRFSAIFS